MNNKIIGSVSSGTMREEDLIPAFLDALDGLNPVRARELRNEWAEINDQPEDVEDSLAMFLNETLFDALDAEALPYFYFGAHPGDGADYGFWLCKDVAQAVRDNDGLVVADTSEVPEDYEGEVLHVNDHGNATLYSAQGGQLTEIWAVV